MVLPQARRVGEVICCCTGFAVAGGGLGAGAGSFTGGGGSTAPL